ncbi:MAG: ribonuclease III [Treponemataceae bacterium]
MISKQRKEQLRVFQKNLNIRFKNLDLLNLSFFHRSIANEIAGRDQLYENCNERLEFLGDAVLDMITADYLYSVLSNSPEGVLSQIKSVVVAEPVLAEIAEKIGIKDLLVLGHGEEKSGGRNKRAILADCLEAVIGAYYFDQGYDAVQKFVLFLVKAQIEKVIENQGQKDHKTLLQEWFQKCSKQCPKYELVKTEGPDHDKTFWVSVHLGGKIFGPECGKSKKDAEQNAAKLALDRIGIKI